MTTTRTKWRGVTVDTRTRAMLDEVVRLSTDLPPLVATQGSFNAGGVSQSAGTHDGAGAIDLDTGNLSEDQKQTYVYLMRKVGFAAWIRRTWQGNWGEHIHAIACGEPDASSGAKHQVNEYIAGRNGLVNKAKDDGPRDFVGTTWEKHVKSIATVVEEVIKMSANIWLMQAQGDGKVYAVAQDCMRKVYLGDPVIVDDIAYIVESGGGKVLKVPGGTKVKWKQHDIWVVRPETLAAIPEG